ncbi:unnamed protein product [Cylicocyclus nassatus]|uniref:Uncharacterized protein n=1 Tax=Cylicocyclus nassatus TaxID=53992 RepID=A0AA36H772_CYLNA|nr:unnamed protein product [Cylicocyclus nassatus]
MMASTFIIGGCIGPKSVLERYLTPEQKSEVRKYVYSAFDGTNSDQVLANVNTYVHSVLRPEQWDSILPELKMYQAQKRECSVYAQLLPTLMYKQLVNSVFKAAELGASDQDLKRLVEDYVDRAMRSGLVPQRKNSVSPPDTSMVRSKPKVRHFPQRIIYERQRPSHPYVPSSLWQNSHNRIDSLKTTS